jgi:demethylmenaquinone methyltransferase/2-methoxy-6-polyprenyl-1,4-benzoquinol methylase
MAFQQREIVGPAGEVVGLDFTQSMLDVANAKLEKLRYKNVSFVQGDVMDLPFEDNSFQAVTNGFALRNVVDIQKTISEMARVTAPGGRVVCIDVSVPQFFLFRWFFNIYYYKIVPIMGHAVDKNKKIGSKFPAYTWLAESLKTLPPQDEIKQMFVNAGLDDADYKGVGFGASTIYWGTKR